MEQIDCSHAAKTEYRPPLGLQKRLEKIEKLLQKTEFYVLVWGPGESAGATYDKRLKVRDHLSENLGSNNILLSEDRSLQSYVDTYGLRVAEALQAISADAIVIINNSIGPHTELLQYEDMIRGKTLVFVPSEHKQSSGFARTAFDIIKVEEIPLDEFEKCQVIRKKANEFAQALRFRKATLGKLGKLFGAATL